MCYLTKVNITYTIVLIILIYADIIQVFEVVFENNKKLLNL